MRVLKWTVNLPEGWEWGGEVTLNINIKLKEPEIWPCLKRMKSMERSIFDILSSVKARIFTIGFNAYLQFYR